MLTNPLSKLTLTGDEITITGYGYETKIDYTRINRLTILPENQQYAGEHGIDIQRVDRLNPELQHQLRVIIEVDGNLFDATVPAEQGEPLARRANRHLVEILGPVESLPDSLRDLVEDLSDGDPEEISYPVHFHSCMEITDRDRAKAGLPLPVGKLSDKEAWELMRADFREQINPSENPQSA